METLRRLRQTVARRPGKLAFLLVSLGISFGFVAGIAAIAQASWFRLPAGVAAGEYVTLGRRTASEVAQLSLADFENVAQLAPEVSWFYQRNGTFDARLPGGEVRRIYAPQVSGRFFAELGVAAAAGSLVAAHTGPAAVLSHALWRGAFAGRADVTEELLQIDGGRAVPIIGVADAPFEKLLGAPADAWILDAPFDLRGTPRDAETAREVHRKRPEMHIFGAVEGAVSMPALRTLFADYAFDASGVVDRSGSDGTTVIRTFHFGVLETDRLTITPGFEAIPDKARDVRQKLVWLLGIVVLLLAMALVSLVDFLMAENLARNEEQTVRIAIGAGPADVFVRTVAENAVWVGLVAVLGWFSFGYVVALLVDVEPFATYLGELPAGARSVGLASGALLLALAFGLSAGYASWFVSRTSRVIGAVGIRPRRMARLTRATLLFVGTAGLLLVFSLVSRYAGDASFSLRFDNVDALLVTASTSADPVPADTPPLVPAIESIPGVDAAASVDLPPLTDPRLLTYSTGTLRDEPALADTPFYLNNVSVGFFRTLGVPLLAGRVFDADGENEAVISRSAAVALAGDVEAALGRPVLFWRNQWDQIDFPDEFSMNVPAKTVVGVVDDVPYGDYAAAVTRVIYERAPWRARSNYHRLLIAHAGDTDDIVRMVRNAPAFESWDVQVVGTPRSRFQEQFMARRSVEMILSGAAAFALMLALAGVANSLARSLAAERSAMGVRLAIGATAFDVSRGYAGPALADLLLVAAAVAALAFGAKLATPALAEVLDLWLLAPAAVCLAVVCATVAHILVRQSLKAGSLNALIDGGA